MCTWWRARISSSNGYKTPAEFKSINSMNSSSQDSRSIWEEILSNGQSNIEIGQCKWTQYTPWDRLRPEVEHSEIVGETISRRTRKHSAKESQVGSHTRHLSAWLRWVCSCSYSGEENSQMLSKINCISFATTMLIITFYWCRQRQFFFQIVIYRYRLIYGHSNSMRAHMRNDTLAYYVNSFLKY